MNLEHVCVTLLTLCTLQDLDRVMNTCVMTLAYFAKKLGSRDTPSFPGESKHKNSIGLHGPF